MAIVSEVVSYESIKGLSKGQVAEQSEPVVEVPEEAVVQEEPAKVEVKEEAPVKKSDSSRDYEAEARSKGWKPKEEFEGDPSDWTPAKAWIKTGEILDSLHSNSRKTKEMELTIAELAKQNAEIERKTYEKAYREAELRQHRAAEVGDVKTVKEATKELMDLAPKAQIDKPRAADGAPQTSKEYQDFVVEHHDWLNGSSPEDQAMRAFATGLDTEIWKKFPALSDDRKIQMIMDGLKKQFPQRFGSTKREETVEVMPAVREKSTKSKDKLDDLRSRLPAHHVRIMANLKRTIGDKFDEKAYLRNVELTGELK